MNVSPLKPGEYHLVVNRRTKKMKCFDHEGNPIWSVPALAKGVGGAESAKGGDTPAGTYQLGALTVTQDSEPWRTWAAFGKYFVDLIELENQEAKHGRAGVGVHGGGSACPDPLALMQPLMPTHGCVRVHNAHMASHIVPLVRAGGRIYLTVQG